MGGDHGPRVTVAASIAAVDADQELSIVLVGLSDAIGAALSASGRTEGDRLRILHAPEVVAEIERTVRAAAPYPVAVNLGHVTYTDTWLWDKSGRFQLDTLTEGQR